MATDVFLHNLERSTLEALRQAMEQGLTPSGLDFAGDHVAILRLSRPRSAEARLVVGVEFHSEENEIVAKAYDAESKLKYATEPCYAHLDGSVRATVSRLLRVLAAKIAGDRGF